MFPFLNYAIKLLNNLYWKGFKILFCLIKIISLPVALTMGILCHATSVNAHATVSLPNKNAIAGKIGTFTLTIPHGCGEGLVTDRIVLTLSRKWLDVQPLILEGWTTEIYRTASNGWELTWTATTGGLPNNTSGSFPIEVRWPKVAGIYNTPTTQYCGDKSMVWADKFYDSADGSHPYPAVYPIPRINIRPSNELKENFSSN